MNSKVVVFNNITAPYTNDLYNHLVAQGVELIVMSCARQEKNRSWADTFRADYSNFVLKGVQIRLSPSRFAHYNFGIFSALDRADPDVLVVSGFYPSMLIATLWAIRRRKTLLLMTDGWRATMPNSLYHRTVRPFVVSHCAAVLVCSRKGADYFREMGVDPGRIFVAPLVPAWPAPSAIKAYRKRGYDILWAAHMTNEVKNLAFFVEFVIALRARFPNLKVKLVGSGKDQPQTVAALRHADVNFECEGSIRWDAMEPFFSNARLFILPSVWESWGLVCNEAMQCGTPCLVSPNVGAAGELVRDGQNGHVIPLAVEAWVDRASALLADRDLWTRYSDACRVDSREISLEKSASVFLQAVNAARAKAERKNASMTAS